MSETESAKDLLGGREFKRPSVVESNLGNGGTGPYAIPNLKIKTAKMEFAYRTAVDFGKLDHLKYFVKHVHHFGIPVFERFLGKLNEIKDIRDKGKYLNAIIQEALAEEKEKLAKKEENRDNSIK